VLLDPSALSTLTKNFQVDVAPVVVSEFPSYDPEAHTLPLSQPVRNNAPPRGIKYVPQRFLVASCLSILDIVLNALPLTKYSTRGP